MLYPEEFSRFLQGGGYLAWGIIPTTDSLREETLASLKKRFETSIEKVSRAIPSELLLSRILLTPSCGAGSRSSEEAAKIFNLLREFKESLG